MIVYWYGKHRFITFMAQLHHNLWNLGRCNRETSRWWGVSLVQNIHVFIIHSHFSTRQLFVNLHVSFYRYIFQKVTTALWLSLSQRSIRLGAHKVKLRSCRSYTWHLRWFVKVVAPVKVIVLENYWELRVEICTREKYKHTLKAPRRVFATNQ